MDKTEYIRLLSDASIKDTTKFTPINTERPKTRGRPPKHYHPLLQKEKQLESVVRKILPKPIADTVCRKGSRLAHLYGLPKTHKQQLSMRPILSSTGTYNFALAKWLEEKLKPLSLNQHTICDIFSFAEVIRETPLNPNDILVSYDVCALFTNVPLDETIEIIAEKAFKNNWFNETHGLNLTKTGLTELLRIATKDQLFQFDGQLYEQVDGVAMGSPLGPLMANVFLCSIEEQLDRNNKLPSFYKRYVDDTLATMPNIQAATAFLSTLNECHPAIQFTMEIAENNKLPFLGMMIEKNGCHLTTSVYHKPTDTGLLLHYQSHVDQRYKRSLLNTMLNRAYRLSSTKESFTKECQHLKRMFTKLKYPVKLINSAIAWYTSSTIQSRHETPTELDAATQKPVRITLPFKDQKSADTVRHQLKDLGRKIGTDLQPVFTSRKIEGKLKIQEEKPALINHQCVVYTFKCDSCDADYIGYTTRHLHQRIEEHKASVIGKHLKEAHSVASTSLEEIRREDIVITKPDKGSGVVVMDKTEYIRLLSDASIKDTTKFTPINTERPKTRGRPPKHYHPLLQKEKQLESVVRKILPKPIADTVCRKGSRLAHLYGLPKTHKQQLSMRPILSSTGTYNFALAKWLEEKLKPLSLNQHTICDIFSFAEVIRETPLNPNDILVSYDVCALFTNVPLDETIEIIAEKAFKNNWFNETHGLNLTKTGLTELLRIATKDQLFQFDGQLYEQVDGVAMGSPLGPLMANVFLCSIEEQLDRNNKLPSFYKRYVDDTLATMPNIQAATAFLSTLNECHPAIQFTMEIAENNKLPFLGMMIEKNGCHLTTSVYHKPTDTGLLLHYQSHVDQRYKRSLLNTMLNRAYRLSSTKESFTKECQHLKRMFTKLKYPVKLINSAIAWYTSSTIQSRHETPTELDAATQKPVRITLPFKDQKSADTVRHQLKDLGRKIGTDLQPVFTSRKIEGKLKIQEEKPALINHQCVVYTFKCDSCDADYIGYTTRHLHQRIEEHKASVIGKHLREAHGVASAGLGKMFSVLKKCRGKMDCLIHEMLFIREQKPKLNTQSDSIRAKVFI
ncbi:hypothetical protein AWC38_SpisGene22596 [Stylophora pistillata]|uniref:Reverse transcriptase domain-containing protein n=1 Tax=Stylophora pistillata TaxID=50429 RepID=A0A2B4R841_STYPI|nr:hypothetical protein AWC38_SpisGene22596 [Stylophora pistillata]